MGLELLSLENKDTMGYSSALNLTVKSFFLLEVWSGRGVGLELLEAQHEDAKLGGGFEQRSSELRLGVIRLGVEDEIIA